MAVEEVASFLRLALRSTLANVTTSDMELGLTSRLSTVAAIELTSGLSVPPLEVSDATVCIRCNVPLEAYGPGKAFAWLVEKSERSGVVHLHCLPGDSSI